MEDAFAARLVGLAVSMTHHGERKIPTKTQDKKKSIKTIHGIFMDI